CLKLANPRNRPCLHPSAQNSQLETLRHAAALRSASASEDRDQVRKAISRSLNLPPGRHVLNFTKAPTRLPPGFEDGVIHPLQLWYRGGHRCRCLQKEPLRLKDYGQKLMQAVGHRQDFHEPRASRGPAEQGVLASALSVLHSSEEVRPPPQSTGRCSSQRSTAMLIKALEAKNPTPDMATLGARSSRTR
uniref:Myosin motor domain-containing protein n=1 Tax=Macrostomum lignano TaxID=282301 RepID=A0A1I8IWH9_9PLAT